MRAGLAQQTVDIRHSAFIVRGMATNVVDALARVPMLSGLDRKHLEKLARDFSEKTFPAGTVVVKEGSEHGIGFFVIADGEAIVSIDGQRSRGSGRAAISARWR